MPVSGLAVPLLLALAPAANAIPGLGEVYRGTLATMPVLAAGELERFLVAAAAALSLAALVKKVFVRKLPIEAEFVNQSEFGAFRHAVKMDMESLRDRLDSRFDRELINVHIARRHHAPGGRHADDRLGKIFFGKSHGVQHCPARRALRTVQHLAGKSPHVTIFGRAGPLTRPAAFAF
jgi:hypothetical protein